jgi:hypothetical protein
MYVDFNSEAMDANFGSFLSCEHLFKILFKAIHPWPASSGAYIYGVGSKRVKGIN